MRRREQGWGRQSFTKTRRTRKQPDDEAILFAEGGLCFLDLAGFGLLKTFVQTAGYFSGMGTISQSPTPHQYDNNVLRPRIGVREEPSKPCAVFAASSRFPQYLHRAFPSHAGRSISNRGGHARSYFGYHRGQVG